MILCSLKLVFKIQRITKLTIVCNSLKNTYQLQKLKCELFNKPLYESSEHCVIYKSVFKVFCELKFNKRQNNLINFFSF